MSSIIEVHVISEYGEEISRTQMTLGYGNEFQRVLVILSDPDVEHVDMTAREALDECMAEQLSTQEGFDA